MGFLSAPVDAPRPGIDVPGYDLLRELGRGGQAVVYLANQRSTGRHVAVKVMAEGPLADDRQRARFDREAQVLAALAHPNIVQVLDRGQAPDGSQFIVMNYVDGRPLDAHLDAIRRSPDAGPDAAAGASLRLFLRVCDAVNAAHLKGVIHRDLKPSNILVDAAGEPHVLDFGLARTGLASAAGDDGEGGGGGGPLTVSGEFLGSLPWSSPEQAEGDPDRLDSRTDVYSLGVILYQLLTGGRFPYAVSGSLHEVLNNILSAQPVPPSRVLAAREAAAARKVVGGRQLRAGRPASPPINPAIEAIVLKALAKRRDDRYQTAGELARDVENYLAGRPTRAASNDAARAATGRHRVVAAAVVVLIALVAGATAALLLLRRPASPPAPIAPAPHDAGPSATQPAAPETVKVRPSPTLPPATAPTYVRPDGPVVEILPALTEDDVRPRSAKWRLAGGELVAAFLPPSTGGTLALPYRPPAEYDFLIEFTRTDGRGHVAQDFTVQDGRGRAAWSMGNVNNNWYGFGQIEGKWAGPGNPSAVLRDGVLQNGRRYTSVVQVRRGSLTAFLDGRLLCRHDTDFREFAPSQVSSAFGVVAYGCGAVFHRIAVIEVTGRGTLLARAGHVTTRPDIATSAGIDPLPVGSVWEGDQVTRAPSGYSERSPFHLTVLERRGDAFRVRVRSGVTRLPANVRESTGTIEGNAIRWTASNTTVIAGISPADYSGTIDGRTMTLRVNKGDITGEVRVTRTDHGPAVPTPPQAPAPPATRGGAAQPGATRPATPAAADTGPAPVRASAR